MKRNYGFLAAGILMLVASSCCSKAPKVTALVAGDADKPVAVVVEYAKAVKADAVTPETFAIPDKEIAFAFVTDECPCPPQECCKGKKPECKPGEKPECCKEGKPECCKDGKPDCKPGEKPECCKGEKPECNGEKPECCKEGKPECKPCCGKDGKFVVIVLKGKCKPECCKGEKPECCEGEKPECKPAEKPECCKEGKPGEKPECCKGEKPVVKAADVKITVQQVADIEYAEGGTAKAWAKPAPVCEVVVVPPFFGKGPKCHRPCPDSPADTPKPEEN